MLDGDIHGWISGGRLDMLNYFFSARKNTTLVPELCLLSMWNAIHTQMKHGSFLFVHTIDVLSLNSEKGVFEFGQDFV